MHHRKVISLYTCIYKHLYLYDLLGGACHIKGSFFSGDVGGNYGTTGSVKNIYVVKEPDVISGDGTLNLLAKLHYQ